MVYGKALVVEDDPDLRSFFCAALNLEKIETIAFGNDAEAAEYLRNCEREELPHLALIDFSLGEKSGVELIGRIRSNPKTQGMKVILVSGWQEVASLAREAGADGFLRKPFDFDALCRLLNDWGLAKSEKPGEPCGSPGFIH